MTGRLDVVGAPSSAGAYTPGQEKAPEATRAAGLLASLAERGIAVTDRGDEPGFRWRADHTNSRAMNAEVAAGVARAVAGRVAKGLAEGAVILVLGGDCTVELGDPTAAQDRQDSRATADALIAAPGGHRATSARRLGRAHARPARLR